MRVLIACEESQSECLAFRALGCEAFSCDLLPCSGGHPEWHIQGDVIPLLAQSWDLVIAHPPCTYLTYAGLRHWSRPGRAELRASAVDFFLAFTRLECPWLIENPQGCMSQLFRPPDQVISPWQFGSVFDKRTCYWLHKLPPLCPSVVVKPRFVYPWVEISRSPKIRSKSFPEVSAAMAALYVSFLGG